MYFDTSHADSVVLPADDEVLPTLQSREYKGGGIVLKLFSFPALDETIR